MADLEGSGLWLMAAGTVSAMLSLTIVFFSPAARTAPQPIQLLLMAGMVGGMGALVLGIGLMFLSQLRD